MKYFGYILVGLVLIGFIGVIGFAKVNNDKNSRTTTTVQLAYSDDNANVMYFYSPNCTYCQQEIPILTELASQGYRVKLMNVKDDPGAAIKFKDLGATGTPFFYSQKDEAKLPGFQEKEALKQFLEAHK